jgi:hypothetical protein
MANEFIARNGLIAQNNSVVTGSLTVTQGISGSFSGSGANLNSIPSSAISGLNLSQIATGSVTASVSPTQFSVISGSSTEFVVTGTGTTIGNSITDTHRITGSLNISGSLTVTGGITGTPSTGLTQAMTIGLQNIF